MSTRASSSKPAAAAHPQTLDPYFIYMYACCRKLVTVTSCDETKGSSVDLCEALILQEFIHVGQQKVHLSIHSYANNLTINSHMLTFHGVIAGDRVNFF